MKFYALNDDDDAVTEDLVIFDLLWKEEIRM